MSNSEEKDYYHILGVSSEASPQEIREAYRKLAFQHHPDRNKDDPESSEKMKALNEAYATLSDASKRKEYDMLRTTYGPAAYARYRQSHSQQDIFRDSDIEQIFQEFSRSFGFRDADEIFREFYGAGFRGYEYRQPGFVFRRYAYNPGQGSNQNPPSIQVKPLGFWGRIIKFILERIFRIKIAEQGKDLHDILRITPQMAGQGGEVQYRYRKRGESHNLMIKIPAGIKSGQTIKLRRMGSPGKAGGEAGDLLLKVSLEPSFFEKVKAFFRIQSGS